MMAKMIAIKDTIEMSNGRRPILSIRSHGIKLAMKNQVKRKPDIRADMCESKPRDCEKIVPA